MEAKSFLSNLSISTKMNAVQAVALVVLFMISITSFTTWVKALFVEDNIATVRQINTQTLAVIEAYNEVLQTNVIRISNVLRQSLPQNYTLDKTERIGISGIQTPVLRAGNQVLNLNYDVADSFYASTGTDATVFVRDGDDFVRITTSLKNESGARAVGTRLNREHPAYNGLLANRTFTGKAYIFGRNYMTNYSPILDASGSVIGALFVGRDFSVEKESLRKKIMDIKYGENGYMFIVSSGSADMGALMIHPALEGKNLYDEKDAKGLAYIRNIVEQKQGVISYWLTPSGSKAARETIAVFDTAPEWEWVIVSELDVDYINDKAGRVRNLVIIGALILGALLFLSSFFSARYWIERPLASLLGAMEQIAAGRLNISITERGNDEVGKLLRATNVMVSKMRSALQSIQHSSQQLADHSAHLVGVANNVADQSEQQNDAATAMAQSIEEMNSNVVHVSENAKQADQISVESDRISGEGATVIQRATDSMTAIANSVRGASEVVNALGHESRAISTIVNVIREIADQTNLLALNAAIEAARAGEQGRGFAVVADEVRKLAERTSSSTQEISELVNRILNGTTNAVASMESGVNKVEEGVSYAVQAGDSIAGIRQSSNQVTAAVSSISNALVEQSEVIVAISHNVEKIAEMSDQNSRLAKESAQYAAELEKLAHTLRKDISHFSI